MNPSFRGFNLKSLILSKKTILIVCGCAVFILILLAGIFLWPHLSGLISRISRHSPCEKPLLSVDGKEFEIKSLAFKSSTPPQIPAESGQYAYWLENTASPYIFILKPSSENIALIGALAQGKSLDITWADCEREEFLVGKVEVGLLLTPNFFQQTSNGAMLYIPSNAVTAGIVVKAVRHVENSLTEPLPTDASTTPVDVEFLIISTPAGQSVIGFSLKLTNRGNQDLTLGAGDLTLTGQDGTAATPSKMEPALPLAIPAGGSVNLTCVFLRPQGSSAILRVFDITSEIYFSE